MKKSKNKLKIGTLLLLLIVLISALTIFLIHRNSNSKKLDQNDRTSKNQGTENLAVPSTKDGSSDKSQNASGSELQQPTGNFVSNHRVSLSNAGAQTQEVSVCTAVVGAECWIEFTKDGTTKALAHKKINDTGSVYWSWQPKEAGLTEGKWKITATATMGDQTKTADDPISLEVEL